MVNKIALTILVSIILTIILVSITKVGTNLILNEPEYSDCGTQRPTPLACSKIENDT